MPPKKYTLIENCCICQDLNCKVPFGLCHCGCEGKTKISTRNRHSRRERMGFPQMFVYGHINRHLREPQVQPSGGYMYIVLSGGYVSLVDTEDYAKFSQFTYHRSVYGYAIRHLPTRKRMSLHREIMNAPYDMCVDHINGDKLDNRKSNLRICTTMQNS